jgi:DNA repair protein RadC
MGFDFGQPPREEAAELFRFTYAVQEEVQVLQPADAGHYLLTRVFTPFEAFEQEEVWALSLNQKLKITHQSLIYRGTLNQAQVRVGEVFRPALKLNAAAIVLSHLHPSGDPSPSERDILVTQQVYEAGKLLQVELIDHLIVGRGCWVSLKSLGLGFEDAS